MKNLRNYLMLLAGVLFLITACKKEEEENPTTPETNAEITANNLVVSSSAYVINHDTLALVSSEAQIANGYFNYRITGGKAPSVKLGTIIIDSVNGGYIRKVTRAQVAGTMLYLETIQAQITDIFESGDLEFRIDFGKSLKSASGEDGKMHYSLIEEEFESGVSASGSYDYDLEEQELTEELTLNGKLTVEPRLLVKWSFAKDQGLSSAYFALDNSKVNLTATLTYQLTGEASASVQKSLGKISKRVWFVVSGVPVMMDIKLELFAKGLLKFEDGMTFPLSLSNTSTLTYGISYSNGTSTFINAFTNHSELTATPSFEAKGQARVEIIPQLTIEFYQVLSNILSPKPYLELNAKYVDNGGSTEMCAQVCSGIDLGLSARGEVMGDEIFDLSKEFNITHDTLWQSKNDCETPGIRLSDPYWTHGSHICEEATPYTVNLTFSDPDTLLGPGATLTAMYWFHGTLGATNGEITRTWEQITVTGNKLSYNICIHWVDALYVEQAIYIQSADGTRSNMITVIIPNPSPKK